MNIQIFYEARNKENATDVHVTKTSAFLLRSYKENSHLQLVSVLIS